MKLPRRTFLHLAAGAAALPAVSRIAWAQTYPTRPVRVIVGFGRRRGRYRRARARTGAVGAARPAIRRREPGGAGSNIATKFVAHRRKTATRCCKAPWPTPSTPSSRPISGSTSPRTSRRFRCSPPCRTSWSCTRRLACAPWTNSSSSRARNRANCRTGRPASAAHRIYRRTVQRDGRH